MMKHECKPIAMADWADEVCSICRASLTLPPYDNLAEAIQRVRNLAEYIGSLPDLESQNIALAIEKALDGEQ